MWVHPTVISPSCTATSGALPGTAWPAGHPLVSSLGGLAGGSCSPRRSAHAEPRLPSVSAVSPPLSFCDLSPMCGGPLQGVTSSAAPPPVGSAPQCTSTPRSHVPDRSLADMDPPRDGAAGIPEHQAGRSGHTVGSTMPPSRQRTRCPQPEHRPGGSPAAPAASCPNSAPMARPGKFPQRRGLGPVRTPPIKSRDLGARTLTKQMWMM